jgi:rhomboid family GlyGly-CTERM serine protease
LASVPLLLRGVPPLAFVYSPAAVADGEWWRLLSHPFVHVSRYHLLLDGAAFLSLLLGLADRSSGERLLLVVAAGAASLIAATPVPGETALYGLSRVGHGLMAATAVLSLSEGDAPTRRAAAILLSLVAGKALLEAATGQLLLDLFHLGDLGQPNRLCHLGGVVGGVLGGMVIQAGRG